MAGRDFLMSRGKEWYARRKHERTLKTTTVQLCSTRGLRSSNRSPMLVSHPLWPHPEQNRPRVKDTRG